MMKSQNFLDRPKINFRAIFCVFSRRFLRYFHFYVSYDPNFFIDAFHDVRRIFLIRSFLLDRDKFFSKNRRGRPSRLYELFLLLIGIKYFYLGWKNTGYVFDNDLKEKSQKNKIVGLSHGQGQNLFHNSERTYIIPQIYLERKKKKRGEVDLVKPRQSLSIVANEVLWDKRDL